MHSDLKLDKNKLYIFHELKKRKIYVGELIYDEKRDVYELIYDKNYARSKTAIPMGSNLDLFKSIHTSKKGQLFPVFLDRIPVKSNPAYEDYCKAEGISIEEDNPLVLLGSIGKRGPSSFVFEPAYKTNFCVEDIIKLREELKVSQNDLALSFGIKKITLQRIEKGTSIDENTIKLLEIYFNFPDVAVWQLQQRKMWVHHSVFAKLFEYFVKRKMLRLK